MRLFFRPYLRYKFFNAVFSGVVGGSVFTIYASLPPSTFSVGGIVLAFGMMGIATLYHRWMRIDYFYRFTLLTEIIMLAMVLYFLLFPTHAVTALIVYAAYQLSFVLGGYLARAETRFARKARIMGWLDVAKQQGYVGGLALSYLFYKAIERYGITENRAQVYQLHWILLIVECSVIVTLVRSFQRREGTA
ncbi:MAG: hypothetical protein AB7S65_06005 [Sulfuricurvum sp.]